MKKAAFVAGLVLILAGFGCAAPARVPPQAQAPVPAPAPAPSQPPAPVPPPVNAPGQPVPSAGEERPKEETKIVEPMQYFPPPTADLSGGKLGNQRVPGLEALGDIHQVYFHLPSYQLFMAVTEPDGLRSVWRVKEQGKPERVFAATAGEGEIAIFGDSHGDIYVEHDNPCRLYRSSDAMKTWHLVHKEPCMFWSIADDGKGNVYGTLHDWNSAILFRSQDDGFTWEPWKDFQKLFPKDAVQYDPADGRFRLRHLHDVIYDPASDRIIVGTGDVARYALESADDGATWKKIWDEGFTAHTVMSGGERYLLAPDQLHNHGIALYDVRQGTVKEVWNPRPYNYAGYSYSIVNVDGIYYAAFHTEANEVNEVVPKFGIIVSPDGEKWYRFLEWGPLDRHARTDIWLAPAPGRVYASVNGALYAFRPLDKAWFEGKEPFK
ncbi:MAG TPA: hypothetical protein VLC10_05300 [Patescibacteria group bacterium]|nr:hypothetical protein [Patescibacteria group bacterium]